MSHLTKHQRSVLVRMNQGWQFHNSGGIDPSFSIYNGKQLEIIRWDTWYSLLDRKFIESAGNGRANGTLYTITDAGRKALRGGRS